MRRFFVSLALLSGTICGQAQAQSAVGTATFAPVRTDDLLLYEIRLGTETLSEAMIAHGDVDDPLLPIGELTRMLGLNVSIQPSQGLVVGRLGESLRPLTIDIASGEGRFGSKGVAIEAGDVQVSLTEIFLRSSKLAELLPLKINVDADSLSIELVATEKLPIEARRDRSDRLMRLGGGVERRNEVLQVASPYRWLSRPGFDFTADIGHDSTRGGIDTRFEARAAVDFLQTGVSAYFATDDRAKPYNARVKAERRSLSGDLFGPLHATYAAVGDIYSPGLTLGPRSVGGVGAVMSTASLEEASVFERINLRGELPMGYDIELYVNDILRAGQNMAAEGRYEFLDVPLVRGTNVIRIVAYGPRGEREESTRVINVGGGQVEKGKTVLDAGIVWQERPLIDLGNDGNASSGLARGQPRAVVSVTHGLSSTLTVQAGGAIWTDQAGEQRRLATTGFRTSLVGFALQLDHAQDFNHGWATSLGLAGRLAGISLVGRHIEFADGFVDENIASFDVARPIRRYSKLTFDLTVPFLVQSRLPVSGRVERSQFVDGGSTWTARGRTAVSVANTLVSMGMDYSKNRQTGSSSEQLNGNISATRLIDYKWQLRASADFDFKPQSELRSLSFTADRSLSDQHSLRFGMAKSFGEFDDLTLQAGLSSRLPFSDVTLFGDYTTDQRNWSVGVQFNFGFAFDPAGRNYRVTRPGPATGASATFHAFRDLNANGLPDPGEKGVEGIVLHGAGEQVQTGANGRAFLTGLGDGPSGMLRADLTKVDTVFDASPPANISFATRAGDVVEILYPIVPTSEVIATMNVELPDGELTGLSAVHLRLVSENGDAIERPTEFDGVAVFEQVKPGRYRLELDSAQAEQLNMQFVNPVYLTVESSGQPIRIDGRIMFVENGAGDNFQRISGPTATRQGEIQ